jgi:hypothetical protein
MPLSQGHTPSACAPPIHPRHPSTAHTPRPPLPITSHPHTTHRLQREGPEGYSYSQLSSMLRCLHHFGLELDAQTLEAVGVHMGRLLLEMSAEEAAAAVRADVERGEVKREGVTANELN